MMTKEMLTGSYLAIIRKAAAMEKHEHSMKKKLPWEKSFHEFGHATGDRLLKETKKNASTGGTDEGTLYIPL